MATSTQVDMFTLRYRDRPTPLAVTCFDVIQQMYSNEWNGLLYTAHSDVVNLN